MSDNEKDFDDIKKQEKQNIPPEVWAQLPDHIKKEIDPNYQPPPPEPVFSGATAGLEDSINRLRDGFEKIGLTLIGRMGEFATTLERVMMIVARIEKVENLVSEIKYFLKGLQKTLDGINMTLNKLDTLDLSIELENIKKILQTQGINTNTPNSLNSAASTLNTVNISPIEETSEIISPDSQIETPSQAVNAAVSDSKIEDIIQMGIEPKEKVKKIFNILKSLLKPEIDYSIIGKNLELTRDAISKCYKWVPTLYDIGKVARNLKSKKGKLTLQFINELDTNFNQWEEKVLSQ